MIGTDLGGEIRSDSYVKNWGGVDYRVSSLNGEGRLNQRRVFKKESPPMGEKGREEVVGGTKSG